MWFGEVCNALYYSSATILTDWQSWIFCFVGQGLLLAQYAKHRKCVYRKCFCTQTKMGCKCVHVHYTFVYTYICTYVHCIHVHPHVYLVLLHNYIPAHLKKIHPAHETMLHTHFYVRMYTIPVMEYSCIRAHVYTHKSHALHVHMYMCIKIF